MSVPDHLTAVVRNARALATRGDLGGAQAMLEQALEPAATVLGPDHPEVLAGTRLLASLHRDLGDLTQARRLLEEAIAAGQFALGEDAPALLPLSYDLAVIADELGNRHEARRNFTALLRYGPAALGADHEYVRAARRYLDTRTPSAAGPSTSAPSEAAPLAAAPSAAAPSAPMASTAPPASVPAPPPSAPPLPRPAPPLPRPAPPLPRPAPPWSPPDSADHREVTDHRGSIDHRHSRVPILALVLVAAMALAGGGIAAYLVLHTQDRGPAAGPQATATAPALRPPGDLKLRDDGADVTLMWTDPTNGAVPFVVAGGRADNVPKTLGSADSGETTYTVHGLNTTANYCFLVAAVYSAQNAVPSSLVCTKRGASTTGPSRAPSR